MGVLQEKMGFCQQRHRCATGRRERGVAEEGVAWGAVLERKGLTRSRLLVVLWTEILLTFSPQKYIWLF